MTRSLGENFLQYKCAIYPLNLIDYPYKPFSFLHPKLICWCSSVFWTEKWSLRPVSWMVSSEDTWCRSRAELQRAERIVWISSGGQLDLSAHFKLQTLLICEAIVCGSEPAHWVPSAAPWSQRFCSSSWGTDKESTWKGQKWVERHQEDKSDGKDSIQLSRGWHFVMDGPRPRIQNNRIAVGEKSQTGVKLWRCDYSVYQLN